MPQLSLHTPFGEITLSEESGALVALDWGRGRDQAPTALLRAAAAQLQAYFDGRRTEFDLPLAPAGTAYRQSVWAATAAIPHGETRDYGAIAAVLRSIPRAVGQALAANPLPILIPCHRVVGAKGRMGGYTGADGPATKRLLLALERRSISQPTEPPR